MIRAILLFVPNALRLLAAGILLVVSAILFLFVGLLLSKPERQRVVLKILPVVQFTTDTK